MGNTMQQMGEALDKAQEAMQAYVNTAPMDGKGLALMCFLGALVEDAQNIMPQQQYVEGLQHLVQNLTTYLQQYNS